MLHIKRLLILLLVFICCCSKNDSVDNIKYNYTLNEFEYNKNELIDLVKNYMTEYGRFEEPISTRYYINDPQIYTVFGKDCDRKDTKFIMIISISKRRTNFNYLTLLTINNKNEYFLWSFEETSLTDGDGTGSVKNFLDKIRVGDIDCI